MHSQQSAMHSNSQSHIVAGVLVFSDLVGPSDFLALWLLGVTILSCSPRLMGMAIGLTSETKYKSGCT